MAEQKYLDELVAVFLSIDNKAEMKDFLFGLLTEKELEELPTRVQIVKLLKQGLPQHDIAEKLGVGIATVTRGSKEIQKGRFKAVK